MFLSQGECSVLRAGGVSEGESSKLRKRSNSCECGVAGFLLDSGDSRDKFAFLLPVSYWLLPTTVFQDDPGWHSWHTAGWAWAGCVELWRRDWIHGPVLWGPCALSVCKDWPVWTGTIYTSLTEVFKKSAGLKLPTTLTQCFIKSLGDPLHFPESLSSCMWIFRSRICFFNCNINKGVLPLLLFWYYIFPGAFPELEYDFFLLLFLKKKLI